MIYGVEEYQNLSINDFQCCSIFEENDNDPTNVCTQRCLRALQSPSLPNERKIRQIHGCRLNMGNLPKCFDKCVSWLHSSDFRMMQQFNFSANCDWSDRLIPGKLYIGPPV
ncbi:hypothetical protein L596_001533 [Steinernema carpocapsae]|uniref:Uncharacterized protein n=1 Tax=Steinernema carpocapsae TaxID=34508 RepID=A0A4U8ULR6_STECR|nr:hypothetical protein L596_001533 [Steinernema carpocapsae]